MVENLFNGQGDTRISLRINLIHLGLSAPLAFVMTFLYGVNGLVASLLAAHILSATYGLFLARKKYAVTVDWASSLRTGIAALSSALLVYSFTLVAPIPTVFKLAAGGLLYLTSFLVFAPILRVIGKEDIENLDELLKGLPMIYPIARRILNLEEKILALNFTS